MTCGFQVWPRFRARFPAAHRWMGRAYVFAGCLPGSVLAFVSAFAAHTPPPGRIGNGLLALLWGVFTWRAWRAARRRRFADHRRWMIRSFALTTSIIVSRVWTVVAIVALSPLLESRYGGDEEAMIADAAVASIWLSWVVNLVLADWWLDRTNRRRAANRPAGTRTAAAPGGDGGGVQRDGTADADAQPAPA